MDDNHEKTLPYSQIPDAPETYSSSTIAARLIDGLGYRYYWATEGLTDDEMGYKISEDSRSFGETMNHIYGLCTLTLKTISGNDETYSSKKEMTWQEKREATLYNLKKASDLLKTTDPQNVAQMKIVFSRGDNSNTFPFWNLINGPISDALTHVGQILAYRRANGNPQPPGVNVLTGKTF